MNKLLYIAASNQRPESAEYQDSYVAVVSYNKATKRWAEKGCDGHKLETVKTVTFPTVPSARIFRIGF